MHHNKVRILEWKGGDFVDVVHPKKTDNPATEMVYKKASEHGRTPGSWTLENGIVTVYTA